MPSWYGQAHLHHFTFSPFMIHITLSCHLWFILVSLLMYRTVAKTASLNHAMHY